MHETKQADRNKLWDLIRKEHTALLVTVEADGSLDARPMGCLQRAFDGTLWFLTFRHSEKLREIAHDSQVLISYARPSDYHYVAVTGRARMVEDAAKLKELWREGFRVWFPLGADDPEIAMLQVTVNRARYWTRPASILTYAWAYIRARATGEAARASEIAETHTIELE
ncbi:MULTISPECIES: pyridoxamine 5'-phosphate oxidase family protein [unclassified Bradyrhizobium]|uniref:pyridoxamine 5'-phosphate oxidase family protein n=1 Tax=unclassified Bradyrhizobium TaxID=2631580 RepID=UPI001FF7F533|nr:MULTISPECIES: pyridoxamine 5'-phosphate oxidase family protein [unclassified Bradyrhizobium]MCK1711641.1 pyridoxamine 5'-phosphate oxidase family protein [Bradyrhizobium sp. 143]MCK1730362.1 pyridoxamine 5'-phosphate oxidase family protein [Bradyrhizobium sp. 142]